MINILDNGFKFTPCFHSSDYFIFRDLLYYFEDNLIDLNKRFFFEDKNFISNSNIIVDEITISNTCDSIDCYFKNIKKPVNPNNFFIQKSSIDFQFEFYKNISNFKYNYKRNLSKEEIYFLLDFIEYKPFKIVELDKNVGVGILGNNLYNSLCLEILTN